MKGGKEAGGGGMQRARLRNTRVPEEKKIRSKERERRRKNKPRLVKK